MATDLAQLLHEAPHLARVPVTPELARFLAKIELGGGGCWLWTAARYPNGYGAFYPPGKPRRSALAHRWLYELLLGPVPGGLDLDHLCRVRHCVNPAHLEPVTRSENLLRGDLRREPQTHCKRGHPLSGDNLYVTPEGRRVCKTCRAAHKRAHRADASPQQLTEIRARDAAHARASRKRKAAGHLAVPNAEKTHCPEGHPLSGENLYVTPQGGRKCRECVRAANRRAYRKRRQQPT